MGAWDDVDAAPGGNYLPVPGFQDARTTPGQRWVYTPSLGEFIATEYVTCDVGGLWGLHGALPDRVPPPAVVRGWCRQFPAFGALMKQADELRAERAMEQTVYLADHSPLAAPRVALQIATRQRLAESLHAARWKPGANTPASAAQISGPGEQPVAVEYSDAELLSLIEAGRATAGEGGTPR